MRIITYTIILSFTIFNPTEAGFWSFIEDSVNTIKTAAGEFASWGDALTDADIPILSDVKGGAGIFQGWVEDGFDKATGQLGDTFDDATDFARRLISFNDALDGVGTVVKTALKPTFIGLNKSINTCPVKITEAVTKISGDITNLASDISGDITNLASDISGDITGLASDISGDITGLASDISGDITNLASDISGDITGLASDISGDMTELGSSISRDITNLGTTMTTHLNDISNTAEYIKGDVNSILNVGIPGIHGIATDIQNIVQILKNPMQLIDDFDDEVEHLGTTLKSCINQFTDLVDPLKALDKVMNIVNVANIEGIVDIDDLAYKLLAFTLLTQKDMIIYVCDDIVPDIIAYIKKVFEGEFIARRRRRMPSDCDRRNSVAYVPEPENCADLDADHFCAATTFQYFYDVRHDNQRDDYRQMVEVYTDNNCMDEKDRATRLISTPYDNSNGDKVQEIRIAKFTFDLIKDIVSEGLCQAISDCQVKMWASKCIPAVFCAVGNAVFTAIADILDFIIGNMDLHDGEITNVRLKAIFRDRVTNNHNQRLIFNTINDRFDKLQQLIQMGSLTSTTGMDTMKREIEFAEKRSIQSVLDKLDQIHEDFITEHQVQTRAPTPSPTWNPTSNPTVSQGAAKVEVEIHDDHQDVIEKELGLISIKLRIMDLYIFVTVLFGWSVLLMIIGILIGKCVYGYKTNAGFAPVAKYDYSTSDVESLA
eukprot:470536_1